MKKIIFIFVALLSAYIPAFADVWTTEDTKREIVYGVLVIADWRQTQDIAHHPDLEEFNELIGEHPNNATINRYFVVANSLQLAIAYILPTEWRKAWQYIGIGYEIGMVSHNNQIGLNIRF